MQIKNDVLTEIRNHYANGGFFLDSDGDPIRLLDEIDVVTDFNNTNASISIVRSVDSMREKLRDLLKKYDDGSTGQD